MKNKLVSVIIPVFNVEKYVQEAIQSIQNQTYTNLEIIVIDDGSTDSTYKLLYEMAKKDKRIKLYKNEHNLKIVKTLNRALKLAKGHYIARMDGDDISALDRIEKQVNFLENNSNYDLVGCSVKSIDEDGNIIGEQKCYSNQKLLDRTLRYVVPSIHATWVVKKEVYDCLQGYRNVPGVEDYDFLLRMKTVGYKYTNLENYYGYFVRLGRHGNTVSTLGVKQRKMHSYVYKCYKERVINGKDTFSEERLNNYLRTNVILQKLHDLSAKFLFKAIKAKGEKKLLKMIFFIAISLISPYQVKYLYERLLYRILVRIYSS